MTAVRRRRRIIVRNGTRKKNKIYIKKRSSCSAYYIRGGVRIMFFILCFFLVATQNSLPRRPLYNNINIQIIITGPINLRRVIYGAPREVTRTKKKIKYLEKNRSYLNRGASFLMDRPGEGVEWKVAVRGVEGGYEPNIYVRN